MGRTTFIGQTPFICFPASEYPRRATSWGEGRANADRKKWKNFPLSVQNGQLVNAAMGKAERGMVICGNVLNSSRELRGYAHSHR